MKTIEDYIMVYNNILPKALCKDIINIYDSINNEDELKVKRDNDFMKFSEVNMIDHSAYNENITSKFINYYHIKRIKKGMTNAAKKKENYHIWWHPHNFGDKIDQNIKNIDLIFSHYEKLKDNYGFVNKKMNEF